MRMFVTEQSEGFAYQEITGVLCSFCKGEVEWKDGHRYEVYIDREDMVFHLGSACESCARSTPAAARAKFQGAVEARKLIDQDTEATLRYLIVQAEGLQKLKEWVDEQVERYTEIVRQNERGVAVANDIAVGATISTLAGSEDGLDEAPPPQTWAERSGQARPGYVYLIASKTGHYKIGRTKDVPNRSNTLRIQLPFDIEVVHYFFSSDYIAAERAMHDQFGHARTNGEWFEMTEADVTWFKEQTDEGGKADAALV